MSAVEHWLAENFVLVLSLGMTVAVASLLGGGLGLWRSAPRLRRPPRPVLCFAASLVLALVGLGGVAIFADGLLTVVPAARAQDQMVGQPAPPLEFRWVADGSPGQLADFRGRVVLVNVWATWCPPCVEELGTLDELQRNLGERGLVVLQISDEDRETVAEHLAAHPMLTRHGVAQPIPWPEFGRPTSFVVDREGIVRRAFSGPRDYAGFEAELQGHL